MDGSYGGFYRISKLQSQNRYKKLEIDDRRSCFTIVENSVGKAECGETINRTKSTEKAKQKISQITGDARSCFTVVPDKCEAQPSLTFPTNLFGQLAKIEIIDVTEHTNVSKFVANAPNPSEASGGGGGTNSTPTAANGQSSDGEDGNNSKARQIKRERSTSDDSDGGDNPMKLSLIHI